MTEEAGAGGGGIREKLSRFERQVTRRERLEIVGCLLAAAVFAWGVFDEETALSKVGASLLACYGCVGLLLLLRSSPSWRAPAPAEDSAGYLTHWKRRHDERITLEKRAFKWTLVLVMPSVSLLVIGERGPSIQYKAVLVAVFVGVVGPLLLLHGARSVWKLAHDLAEVEAVLMSVGETDGP
jgi:hypothetical protein